MGHFRAWSWVWAVQDHSMPQRKWKSLNQLSSLDIVHDRSCTVHIVDTSGHTLTSENFWIRNSSFYLFHHFPLLWDFLSLQWSLHSTNATTLWTKTLNQLHLRRISLSLAGVLRLHRPNGTFVGRNKSRSSSFCPWSYSWLAIICSFCALVCIFWSFLIIFNSFFIWSVAAVSHRSYDPFNVHVMHVVLLCTAIDRASKRRSLWGLR